MATAIEARELWFLGTRVSLPVAAADGGDGISLLESVAGQGDSPPLHVHRTEDEAFHVLEGTLRLRVGDDELVLEAGESALAVKGVPHTYRVESPRARWLVVTTHGDFERFVRAVGRPAGHDGLPPAAGPPSVDEQRALAETAAAHGIELVGPPLAAHD
jgi:quercetin dioxygenase-like cupin family protein